MRKPGIIIFLFHCFCFHLFGQDTATYPPITINESSIKVGQLLKEITRQTGADFSFNSNVVDVEMVISFEVENSSLEKTLELLCKKIEVEYLLIEGQIVLNFPKNKSRKEEFMLTGFLADETSGETLIAATIAVKGTSTGTFTNEFGYFALLLPAGKHSIVFSYIGFESKEMEIILEKNWRKNINLSPISTALPAVVIGLPLQDILNKKQLDEMELHPDELNSMPEFAGESGLVKGLQSLPGIKMHSDASAFFYTRGGERDQNLIIIDDAPIYNPSHLFGVFSMVIPDFTKSIKVYKNDMPVSMGDRLSSIVDIRTNDGNLNKAEFNAALNPLINRFSVETPITKKKSSVFLSYRRTNFEWIYKRAASTADLFFQDVHLKFNFKLNEKNRLFITTIHGGDFFENLNDDREKIGVRWGNFATTFRWNHIFGPRLFSNTTISSGNYAYRLNLPPNLWKSELGVLSFKSDFTHYAGSKFKAKFGFEMQGYFISPGILSSDSTISVLPDITTDYNRKSALYYQGIFDLSKKVRLTAGIRLTNWENLGPKTYYGYDDNYEVADTFNADEGVYNSYMNIDPRLSLQFQLDPTSQLKLSYGRYHQYLQIISNSISPFTSMEIWLPANPNILPQAATQWSINYLKYFEKSKMEISGAAYYKNMDNQIDYEAHATTLLNPFLEAELRFGNTQAYGVEFLLKKDFGRFNGWLGYTYARVFRKTDDLNDGNSYRAFQDRPHDFSMLLNFRLKRRIILTTYWTSYSGSPFTSPVGFYDFNEQTIPIYGGRNNDRLPAYHRLDLGIKFILNKKEDHRFQHSLTFSIYNALAHQNVFAVKFNKIEQDGLQPKIPVNVLLEKDLSASQIEFARFFPSLTYKFKI